MAQRSRVSLTACFFPPTLPEHGFGSMCSSTCCAAIGAMRKRARNVLASRVQGPSSRMLIVLPMTCPRGHSSREPPRRQSERAPKFNKIFYARKLKCAGLSRRGAPLQRALHKRARVSEAPSRVGREHAPRPARDCAVAPLASPGRPVIYTAAHTNSPYSAPITVQGCVFAPGAYLSTLSRF